MRQLEAPDLATRAADEGFVLLDVREPWEWQAARIRLPGTTALEIPMMGVPARLSEIPTTRPVACICHHGVRSAQVVAFLMHRGYTDVYNLAGGIDAWSAQVDPSLPRY